MKGSKHAQVFNTLTISLCEILIWHTVSQYTSSNYKSNSIVNQYSLVMFLEHCPLDSNTKTLKMVIFLPVPNVFLKQFCWYRFYKTLATAFLPLEWLHEIWYHKIWQNSAKCQITIALLFFSECSMIKSEKI